MLNYGYHPRSTYITHSREAGSAANPAAVKMKNDMQESLAGARAALKQAQDRAKYYADKHRREINFNVGDKVLLSTRNIKIRGRKVSKLMPKFIGPYEIFKKIGTVAYTLKLPPTSKIFPTFHVSLLRPYKQDPTRPQAEPETLEPKPPPDEEGYFKVEKILDHRTRRSPGKTKNRKKDKYEYFLSWQGYPSSENSWEPESYLTPDLVEEYWAAEASRGRPVGADAPPRPDK